MLSRAHRNFKSNWISILLAVISIIQGLAFNDLAIRLHTILDYTTETRDFVPAAHFILAFILLLRIFQTYVTAALDYDEWTTNFPDVLLIFVIGLLEYHVFSSLVVPGFLIAQLHKRMSIISVLALIGYIRAFASLDESMFSTYEAYLKERRLQAVNIGGIVVLLSMSLLVILVHSLPGNTQAVIGIFAATALALNIGYSLKVTFSTRIDVTEITNDGTVPIRSEPRPISSPIHVRNASRRDVAALAGLMSEHFGYVYSAAFDTSPRMTQRILLSLLRAANGRIPDYGYRSFQVACDDELNQVIGLLKCSTSESDRSGMIFWLLLPAIIVYHLGLIGLVRTLKNWRVLHDMVPEITQDELYIQYIAVDSQFQKAGVGARLILRALELTKKLGKSRVALDVREPNKIARKFFRAQGFRDELLMKRISDQFIGKGPTIRMQRAIAQNGLKVSR